MARHLSRIFMFSSLLLAASAASALDVLYCVPANGNVHVVKAAVWSFLLRGDSLRILHRDDGEKCVHTLLSPEKEQMISKALAEKGLSVHKYISNEAETTRATSAVPDSRDKTLSSSCHVRLDYGSDASKRQWLYVQEGRWRKVESESCPIDVNCRLESAGAVVRVRFLPGTHESETHLAAGHTWRVPVPTGSTCVSQLEVGID